MRTQDADPGLTAMIVLTVTLSLAIAAYDVAEVAAGHPERGLFIIPAVLFAFATMLVHLKRFPYGKPGPKERHDKKTG